jgi:hypothetical protein
MGFFSLYYRVQTGSEAHSASYIMGTWCSFSGVKRPEREVKHPRPSITELRTRGAILPLPQIRLHDVPLN